MNKRLPNFDLSLKALQDENQVGVGFIVGSNGAIQITTLSLRIAIAKGLASARILTQRRCLMATWSRDHHQTASLTLCKS